MRMAEVHGTLGCLSVAGAANMEDLRSLYTGGLSFYEWTADFCINTECSEFFNVSCDGSFFSDDEDYLREKLQYEEYLKINSSD